MSLCKNLSQKCARLAVVIPLVAASALAAQAQVVFSPPKNISNSSGNTQSQQVAVDSSGKINVVWADNSLGNYAIFFSRSSDNGNTFSVPVSISKHAQSTASVPRIAVDASGNISVVWTEASPDGSSKFVYFSHSADGVTFTNPHNISGDAGAATGPQIAVDSGGGVNVVWVDTSLGNSEIFFSRSTDGGTSFSTPLNISNDTFDSRGPQIAVDANGNINLAWEDNTVGDTVNPRNDVFFSRSTDGGASFSAPLAITQSSEYSYASFPLQVASGSNGNIDLLWVRRSVGGYADVLFARSTDGGAAFSQTGGAGYSSSGMMAIDPSGNEIGIVGSNDIDNGEPAVNFRFSGDAGATFPYFGGTAPISNGHFFIVADAIGRFNITYTSGGLYGGATPCLCFTQSNEGKVFSAQQSITSQVSTGVVAMALDAGGNVYVAWLQSPSYGANANVFFSRGVVPPFSFSVSPTSVTEGNSATGTLKLISPAPSGGAVISLSSNSPAVSVPASVTVPEGASSATLTATGSAVASTTYATITASLNGSTNTANLHVDPLFELFIYGNTTGGNTASGEVYVPHAAPSGGLVVSLSSSNGSIASVPASVTVAAGSYYVLFNVPTTPVSTPTTVQITGTGNGFTHSASFTVQPAIPQQLSVSPTTAINAHGSTGTVTLSGPAITSGAVVALSSSDPSASVPASVTIPAGATSASFPITTNPGSSTTAINVTISASYNGVTRSTSLTVQPLFVQQVLLFSHSSVSVGGGSTVSGNVDMTGPAPAGGIVVSLSSSDPSIASVPASITIGQGSIDSSVFNINTSPVSADTTVTISATFDGSTKTATLTVQPIMLVNLFAFNEQGGASDSFFVGLNAPATSPAVVSMSSSNPSVLSVPATVTLPQGISGTGFPITTSPVTAPTSVTITASYNGVTLSQTITVHP